MQLARGWNKPTNPHVPVVVFVSIAVVQLIAALIYRPGEWGGLALSFAAGLLCWSATEYFFHRVLFHVPIGNRPWDFISRHMHWQHHEEPKNPGLVAAALIVTVPIYLLLTGAVYLGGGAIVAAGWGAGFGLGYTAYERIHYVVHFHSVHGPVLGFLRRHHALHHFQDHHKRFGVSSPLWDWVFRSV